MAEPADGFGDNEQPQSYSNPGHSIKDSTLQRVLDCLAKSGFKDAERAVLKEFSTDKGSSTAAALEKAELASTVSSYQSKNDPKVLIMEYRAFVDLLSHILDQNRGELGLFLYPFFAYMYLEMICNAHKKHAEDFVSEFASFQESFWKSDIAHLSSLKETEHMKASQWFSTFHELAYVVRISSESLRILKDFFKSHSNIERIIKTRLHVEVFDGTARSSDTAVSYSGSLLGEAARAVNKLKVSYGLIREAAYAAVAESSEANGEGGDGKKKKKAKPKDPILNKRTKADPNAPAAGRIPLPELSELVKEERLAALRESTKRVQISAEHLPTVCYYSILNATSRNGANCARMTDDSELLAVGFGDSGLSVFALDPEHRLKPLKPASELDQIDKDADDVWSQASDDTRSTDNLCFYGHAGPVYGVSFSPDRASVLSASEDSTVRLWSLQTWTSLVVYRTPGFPLWDVDFSPYGHYFATGGADRNALLWSCDRPSPLRVFVGHFADVNTVLFHPNCNYVAAGSADRSIRLFDVLSGNCVRYFTGHKGAVHTLQFSPDGRFLASGGSDGRILLWDLGYGAMVADIHAHSSCIYALNFSRDGLVLASAGSDNCVKFHQISQVISDVDSVDAAAINPRIDLNGDLELVSFPTKSTATIHLHFTRKNLVISVGSFNQ